MGSCEKEIVINNELFKLHYYSHYRVYEYEKDTIRDTVNYFIYPGDSMVKTSRWYTTTEDTISANGFMSKTISIEMDGNEINPASPPYNEYPQNPVLDLDLFIYPKWEILSLSEEEMLINLYYGNGYLAEKISLTGSEKTAQP